MKKALILFLKIAIVIIVSLWLVQNPGEVTIRWYEYTISTSAAFGLVCLGILVILGMIGFWTLRRLSGVPQNFDDFLKRNKRREGFRALTNGLVAVSAGDHETAQRCAEKADTLLHDPTLTLLLQTESAQLIGDEGAVRKYLTELIKRPETAFLGVRGLLAQAMRYEEFTAALKLARRAYEMQPTNRWLLKTYFMLLVRLDEWREAETILKEAIRLNVFSAETGLRHYVAVLLGMSDHARSRAHAGEALQYAAKALKNDGSSIPAAKRLVDMLIESGKPKEAIKVIQQVWPQNPHPELAAHWLRLSPNPDAQAKINWLMQLAGLNKDTTETNMAIANLAIEAHMFELAREHLGAASQTRPESQRLKRTEAQLEKMLGNDDAAFQILNNLLDKPSGDPSWVCEECGAVHWIWDQNCHACHSFDSMIWTIPSNSMRLVPSWERSISPSALNAMASEPLATGKVS